MYRREQWAALAQRIEQLLNGQQELFPPDLDPELESTAQRYAAQVVRAKARVSEAGAWEPDYQNVDIESLDVLCPRSVSIEHAALSVLRQVELDQKLEALGFTSPQLNAAIGTIIARMAAPCSELATPASRRHWPRCWQSSFLAIVCRRRRWCWMPILPPRRISNGW